MHKKDITTLLKIQGVKVKNIKYSDNNLNIYIETNKKSCTCPKCHQLTNKIHDYRTQSIKHLIIDKSPAFLVLKKRRYVCPNCNKRFYEDYSFIQRYFRNSNFVYNKVIRELKQLKNFKTVAEDNCLSTPTVVRYLNYEIALQNKTHITKLPKHIGIDEFKGNCNGTKYQVHIFDLDTHKTIDIIEGRSYDVLENYLSKISNRSDIKLVSMDLYNPFKRVVKDKLPNAMIVADCFHFTRIAMQALDELRLKIWRNTESHEKKYFRYLKLSLMKDMCKVNDRDVEKLQYAFELSPILKYAYILVQEFFDIKRCNTFEEKEKRFRRWLDKAEGSTIQEFSTPVKTLRQWHEYISNAFKTNISNGGTEGKNNLVKTVKRISFGFRNLQNFRNRLLLIEL